MPRVIAVIVSAGKATLHELQTLYSLRDAYDLVDIVVVDGANRRKSLQAQRANR